MPQNYDSTSIAIPFIETAKEIQKDTINPFLTYQQAVSIADAATQPQIVYRKSLFTYHKLPKISAEETPRLAPAPNGWIFCLLIGVLILLGFMMRNYHSKLIEVVRSCFSNRFLGILLKDSSILKRTLVPLIYIAFIILVSLFIFQLFLFARSPFLLPDSSAVVNFLVLFVGINVLLLLRILIINFFGNVFMCKKSTELFLINDINYTFLMCFVLLPLLFVSFFSDNIVAGNATKIATGVVAFLYLLKLLRSFNITLFYNRFSKLYLFYYLCSLEIIPILVIGKIVISY